MIGAVVDIGPSAEGVLFAMGSRFGGHTLYVKDGRLHYVNNFLGSEEQLIVGSEDIPTGKNLLLTASFEKEEQRPDCAVGTMTLYHGDRKVGMRKIRTQLGAFAIAGSASTWAATRVSRSPATTRASRRTRSPAAPSTGSRSTSAATRTWTSSAKRSSC